MQQKKIQITYCITKRDTIQAYPSRTEDHRAKTRILDTCVPYIQATWRIQIEGCSLGYSSNNHYSRNQTKSDKHGIRLSRYLQSVHNIDGSRIDIPLILVQLVKIAESKTSFNVTKMGHILIKVKPQKNKIAIPEF